MGYLRKYHRIQIERSLDARGLVRVEVTFELAKPWWRRLLWLSGPIEQYVGNDVRLLDVSRAGESVDIPYERQAVINTLLGKDWRLWARPTREELDRVLARESGEGGLLPPCVHYVMVAEEVSGKESQQ